MNNKKTWGTFVVVITLLLAVVITSYAYFAANLDSSATTNVSITSKSVDSLTFTPGTAISFTIDDTNLAPGAGNVSDSTTSTVALTANNTTSATYCYNIDFNRISNTFVYTSGSTKEIALTVKKGATTLLNEVDITIGTGTIKVPTASGGGVYKHEITAAASQSTTDTITATVTFINLGTSQEGNVGKSMTANLKLTRVDC